MPRSPSADVPSDAPRSLCLSARCDLLSITMRQASSFGSGGKNVIRAMQPLEWFLGHPLWFLWDVVCHHSHCH